MAASDFDRSELVRRVVAADDLDVSAVLGEAFDTWYEIARTYARGELAGGAETMAEIAREALLFFAGADLSPAVARRLAQTFTQSVLHGNFRKLCRIFKTKPRFSALVDLDRHPALVAALKEEVPAQLVQSLRGNAGEDADAEAMRSLRSWAETMVSLARERGDGALQPTVAIRPLVHSIAHSTDHSILRTEAVLTAQVVGAACPSARGPLVAALVEMAGDEDALGPAWQLGLLDDPRCMERLMARIEEAPRNASTAFPTAVLNSLYSALVNEQHKHVDRSRPDVSQSTDARAAPGSGEEEGKGPAPAGPAVAESRFNAPRHAAALSRIVRSCEAAMGEVDAAQDGGSLRDSDRPDEVLRVAGALLEITPGEDSALDLMLRPPTLNGLAHVSGMGASFPEHTWTHLLLPFLREQLGGMSVAGVSGEQMEQEVASLVRECGRVFYLASEKPPSAELGAILFSTVCNAMRHGYIETERFPQIAATIAATHMPVPPSEVDRSLDPCTWLVTELSEEDPSHRTVRALVDTASQLLGLTTTASGGELATEVALSDAQIARLLHATAAHPSRGSVALWRELVANHTAWTVPRESALRALVEGCSNVADAARARLASQPPPPHATAAPLPRGEDALLSYLTSVADLLRALAPRCPTAVAAPLLGAMTSLMDVHRRAGAGYRDEALSAVLAKLPADAEPSPRAVAFIVHHSGVEPRCQLARARPAVGLRDRSVEVRLAAMRALAQQPAAAGELGQLVLTAWIPGRADLGVQPSDLASRVVGDDDSAFAARLDEVESETRDAAENASLGLSEATMAEAAAPLLAHVAVRRPTLLSACLARLVWAADITKENDAESNPSADVLAALRTIATQAPPRSLTAFSLSHEGRAMLPSLNALSPDWLRLTQRLVDSDYLRANPITSSLRVGREAGASAAAERSPWMGVADPAAAKAAHVESAVPAEAVVEKERRPQPSAPPLAPAKTLRASPPSRSPRTPHMPRWFRARDRQPAYEVGEAADGLVPEQQQQQQSRGVEMSRVPAGGARRLSGHAYLRLAESDDLGEEVEDEAEGAGESAQLAAQRSNVRPARKGVLAKTRSVMARATAALAGADAVEAEVEGVHKAASAGLWMEAARRLCGVMTRHPKAAEERGLRAYLRDTLLPGLRGTLSLAGGEGAVGPLSPEQMGQAEMEDATLREVQDLCPQEAEEVLGASGRRRELRTALVRAAYTAGGGDAARAWMSEHGLHDPALAEQIDRWEYDAAREGEAAFAGALPAAPRHPIRVEDERHSAPARSEGSWRQATAL